MTENPTIDAPAAPAAPTAAPTAPTAAPAAVEWPLLPADAPTTATPEADPPETATPVESAPQSSLAAPRGLSYAVDIVFCVDVTGSMTPILDAVKANALLLQRRPDQPDRQGQERRPVARPGRRLP